MDPTRFANAEALLRKTWDRVHDTHGPRGHDYVRRHFKRYIHLAARFPELRPGDKTLEVGASILSSALRQGLGAEAHAVYHELEPEWPARFEREGIRGHPIEFMRDPLPFSADTFDLILFTEVVEHFPLAPDFFFRQLFRALKPGGTLIFSVPNFSTLEKRIGFLSGRNPQDPMDSRFIYYAHHREPVMDECLKWITGNGGLVRKRQWTDYDVVFRSRLHALMHLGDCLRRRNLWQFCHHLVPSCRNYLFVEAGKAPGFSPDPVSLTPPLSLTAEFARRP